jgi:hypothetical protein
MTIDALDATGRLAAAALFDELSDLDTEAALAEVMTGAAIVASPAPDHRSPRRWPVVAAAVVVLAVAVGSAVAIFGDDEDRVRSADVAPVDADDYGPVIGRLVSQQDPDLIAEVHGPELLGAADEVAVVITGAEPGRRYSATLCLRAGLPETHPGVACADGGEPFTVGADGVAMAVVRLPAVFMGTIPITPNDCRRVACDLRVDTLIENDEPDAGVPGTRFVDADDPWYTNEGPASAPSPWIPLRFDPDSEVAIPTMSVRPLDGTTVTHSGSGLIPGRATVVYEGWTNGPPSAVMLLAPDGRASLGEVEIGADGTFTSDLALPSTMENSARVSVGPDGSEQIGTVDCTSLSAHCWLRLQWSEPTTDARGVPALLPEPLVAPAEG